MVIPFADARECLNEIYTINGYESAKGFITFLSKLDIISIKDRENLQEFLSALELNKPTRAERRKKRKMMMEYFDKKGKEENFIDEDMYKGLFEKK